MITAKKKVIHTNLCAHKRFNEFRCLATKQKIKQYTNICTREFRGTCWRDVMMMLIGGRHATNWAARRRRLHSKAKIDFGDYATTMRSWFGVVDWSIAASTVISASDLSVWRMVYLVVNIQLFSQSRICLAKVIKTLHMSMVRVFAWRWSV